MLSLHIKILPYVLIDGERATQESCQGTGQCKEMHLCLELEAELLVWLRIRKGSEGNEARGMAMA